MAVAGCFRERCSAGPTPDEAQEEGSGPLRPGGVDAEGCGCSEEGGAAGFPGPTSGSPAGDDAALLGGAPARRRRCCRPSRRLARGGAAAATALLLLAGSAGPALPRLRALHGVADGVVGLKLGDDPVADGVSCFIDAYQVVLRLANMATSIVAAEQFCAVQEDDNQIARCNAAAHGSFYNFVFFVGALAQTLSDCAGSVNAPATCIAAYAGFIGNLDVIIGTASSATQTCSGWYWDAMKIPANGVTSTLRTTTMRPRPTWRPTPKPKPSPALLPFPTPVPSEFLEWNNQNKAAYQTSVVKCWIATGQGPMFLMRAGLVIKQMTEWCTPEKQTPWNTEGHMKCAIDVLSLLGSLCLATRFISLAIPACVGTAFIGDGPVGEAACAADASGVAAGLFAALAPGLQLKKACSQNKTKTTDVSPMFFDFPDNRRLMEEDFADEDFAAMEARLKAIGAQDHGDEDLAGLVARLRSLGLPF